MHIRESETRSLLCRVGVNKITDFVRLDVSTENNNSKCYENSPI